MSDSGAPPVIPSEFQIYNSYVEDPKWQRRFSVIWLCVLAMCLLLSLPHLNRSIVAGRAFKGLFGISEDLEGMEYTPILNNERKVGRVVDKRRLGRVWEKLGSVFYWTLPGVGLDAGQLLLVIGYITVAILCIVINAPLISNSNRSGFLALAQFPIVFLFATKNSIVLLLLGPGHGYEKLNFIHKWSGRLMFFGGLLHGVLWIRNHLQYGLPILGQQKEASGVAAFALLCVIVLTSLRPVRRYFYQMFFLIHVLSFVAFFVTICYHTIYASPWIFPPLAFYGLDILMRMLRYRIKDALLVPVGNQMTLVHIPHCSDGWVAGQHVRLRVFFSGRVFESHPLTILSAPSNTSCIKSYPQGITLGARVMGDWSRALNEFASQAVKELEVGLCPEEKISKREVPPDVPIQVMLDGPYGGCSIDLGRYENILLFAGGAGATFTIGLLDDIVGRCTKRGRAQGERTRRIEFAWCVRSFGSIDWFSPALMDIATVADTSPDLDLHISIYVTCLCNPEAILPIPNCDVTMVRPSAYRLMHDLIAPPTTQVEEVDEASGPHPPSGLPWIGAGGGLAVCASGPESLTREAANAVARLHMTSVSLVAGSIALHTEVFGL